MTISTGASRTAGVGHRQGRMVLHHQPVESPAALGQAVQDLQVCSRTGVRPWAHVLPQQQPGKGDASDTGPPLPTLPPLSSWLPSWVLLSAVPCQAKIFV